MKKIALLILCLATAIGFTGFAACSKGEKYTLTFYTNGGTEIQALELKEGENIPVPAVPEKEYFTFEGWYEDGDLENRFLLFGEPMPAKNLTAYAAWIPDESVKIAYDAQGGSEVKVSVGTVGSVLLAPEEPVREGYAFGGWYTEKECTNAFAFTVFPAENMTLYAKWVNDPAYVYVTYNGNGREIAKIAVKKGATVEETAFFADDIVTNGWFVDEAMTSPFVFGNAASENIVLYTSYYTEGLKISDGAITGYDGTSENVIAPAVYEGKAVTAVSDRAFIDSDIVSLVLPESIASVGREAFYGAEYLTSVNLGANLKSIGEYAFYRNTRLRSFGDISSVTAIPAGLFLGCANLTEIALSDNVTSVGAQAFAGCERIAEMVIPDGVSAVPDSLFDGCTALESVTLPASMTSFGKNVFDGCKSLQNVSLDAENKNFSLRDGNLCKGSELLLYITGAKTDDTYYVPASVESIAAGAFAYNRNLKTVVVREGTAIACGAFKDIQNLETLVIPVIGDGAENDYLAYIFGAPARETEGGRSMCIPSTLQSVTVTGDVENVSDYAFYGALGLKEAKGMDKAVSVGDYAFAYTALESFQVPANLQSFGEGAFAGTKTLWEYTLGESSIYSVYEGALYNKEGTRLISFPAGRTQAVFTENLTSIASYAFTDTLISEVVLPDTVTDIEYNAFNGCTYLEKLTVPFIGNGSDRQYLPYIFGASVSYTTDEEGKYDDIRIVNSEKLPANLKSVTVTKPVVKVPDFAFYTMVSIEEVNLPEGLEEYGAYSFCFTGLKELSVPEGVKVIGDMAFSQCIFLTSVTFPSTLTKAGEGCFALDLSLAEITFSEGITEIGDMMFYAYTETDPSTGNSINSSSLNCNIVIPASVEKIGQFAFFGAGIAYDSSTGKYVRNPGFAVSFAEGSKLKTVGPSSFTYSGLAKIELPATVETIGAQSFAENNYLEEVVIGDAVNGSALTLIDEIAFSYDELLTSFTVYSENVPQMAVKEYKPTETTTVYLNAFYLSNSVKIYVPAQAVSGYAAAEGWKDLAANIAAIEGE